MKFNILNNLNGLVGGCLSTDSLFEELGEISDLFSPYLNEEIFENDVLIKLWHVLVYVYINNPQKKNRSDALSFIYDVYIYAVNIDFSVDKKELIKHYLELSGNDKLDQESKEILEEILFDI